jgi:hypothetical protein
VTQGLQQVPQQQVQEPVQAQAQVQVQVQEQVLLLRGRLRKRWLLKERSSS